MGLLDSLLISISVVGVATLIAIPKRRSARVIATLLTLAATQAMAQNSIELEQVGMDNVAELQQTGLVESSTMDVSQIGNLNTASITQIGEAYFKVANLQQPEV